MYRGKNEIVLQLLELQIRLKRVIVVAAQQHETAHKTTNVVVNKVQQIAVFFTLTSVVLFTLLFTAYPPIHDFFHGLRHALMIIPCH